MSDSNVATMNPSHTKIIPIRRVLLSDPSQLPSDYSQTPGGTLFSTTPGGTRIIYDRNFLMQCRNSPLAKSPPPNLPNIPGVTVPDTSAALENGQQREKPRGKHTGEPGEEPQFEMDI